MQYITASRTLKVRSYTKRYNILGVNQVIRSHTESMENRDTISVRGKHVIIPKISLLHLIPCLTQVELFWNWEHLLVDDFERVEAPWQETSGCPTSADNMQTLL